MLCKHTGDGSKTQIKKKRPSVYLKIRAFLCSIDGLKKIHFEQHDSKKEYNKITRGKTNEMWGVTTKTEAGQIDHNS